VEEALTPLGIATTNSAKIRSIPACHHHSARLANGIVTLKNRTLSPVAQLFIECAREVAKPLAKRK